MSNNLITNPIGRTNDALNTLKFYFPHLVANGLDELAVITAFNANNAKYAALHPVDNPNPGYNNSHVISPYYSNYYSADNDERTDLAFAYGDYVNKPVYGTLTLGNTDPNVKNGNQYTGIDNNIYTFNNIVLLIALIEMSQPSNVVETKITGRDGKIKEFISLDDWDITISSVVTYPPDNAPKDFMHALMRMKQAPVAIPVTNYFLNAFGVTHIVIKDINPVQEEGKYSSLAFSIKASSDIPLTELLP